MKLFSKKPTKTAREQRDEMIDGALAREQAAAAEMARAANYKSQTVDRRMDAENDDESRLMAELQEVATRKMRLNQLSEPPVVEDAPED